MVDAGTASHEPGRPWRERRHASAQGCGRQGRGFVPLISALLSFTLLLLCVIHYFLLPALSAARTASPEGRKLLATDSWLVLMVVLFVLVVLLGLSFRIGRLFIRPDTPRVRTNYPDAWAEAGRRLRVPDEEGGDDPPGHE